MGTNDSNSSAGRVTIIVALIGLFGTILTLVINNWDKLFGDKNQTVQTINNTPQIIDTITKEFNNNVDPKKEDISNVNTGNVNYVDLATTLCKQWWNDIGNDNVDGLIYYSAVPFSPDKKDLIYSETDLRNYYTDLSTGNPRPSIFSIEIYKASELKQKGLLTSKADTLFGNLQMGTDPFLGVISWKLESGSVQTAIVYFKNVNRNLKIVGFED